VNTSRRWGHAIVCCLLAGFVLNPGSLAHSTVPLDSRAMLGKLLSARPTLRALLTVVGAKVPDEQVRAVIRFAEQHNVDLDRELRVSWRKDEIRLDGHRLEPLVDPALSLDANVERIFLELLPPNKSQSAGAQRLATVALMSALVPTFFTALESDESLAGLLLLAMTVNHAKTTPRLPMEGVRAASCNMADGSVNVELSDGMKIKVAPTDESVAVKVVDRKGDLLGHDAIWLDLAPAIVGACKDSMNTFAKLTNRMRFAVTLAGASKFSSTPPKR
jgi:hypothetical protein